MNTNLYNRGNYTQLVIPLKTDDDKNSCYQLLRNKQNETLCQGIYDDKYINAAIEQSDYILIRHKNGDIANVVAFALVQIQRKSKTNKMDILLTCTIPNKERYGVMIAYDIYGFALKKVCKKIYTSPRTSDLRTTFIKYGFRHHVGIENYSEVLVTDVKAQTIEKVNKTLKRPRTKKSTHYNIYNSIEL
jgi:hypothetical protein